MHSKNADELKNAERLGSFTFSMNVLTKHKGRIFRSSKFRIDRFLEFESICQEILCVCTWLLGSFMHLLIASVGEKAELDGLYGQP